MNSYSKIKGTEKDFVANFVLKASRGDSARKFARSWTAYDSTERCARTNAVYSTSVLKLYCVTVSNFTCFYQIYSAFSQVGYLLLEKKWLTFSRFIVSLPVLILRNQMYCCSPSLPAPHGLLQCETRIQTVWYFCGKPVDCQIVTESNRTSRTPGLLSRKVRHGHFRIWGWNVS